jgi:beta-N-acetylhexosaminidase
MGRQVNKMRLGEKTLDLMAGHRLILGFDGVEFNDDLKHIINEIKASGIILFKRNIDNPEQVTKLCKTCQEYAKECQLPPLFIGVDQEGGVVARLEKPFTVFKGNPYIKSVEDASQFASITADELNTIGINMNFAPVLDIVPDGIKSIMKTRAFKGDAKAVSKLGMQVILGMQAKGIMAVAKHFPGIGRTIKDSHFHLPVLEIDLKDIEKSDMLPFKEAKKHNVSCIMLSHISYPDLDNKWQASLSPFIANDLLRKQMGFQGLVITDDLDMKAIEHDMKTCIRQILKSDIDIALICHKGPDADTAFHEIKNQIKDDELLYKRCRKSFERVLKYKRQYLETFA